MDESERLAIEGGPPAVTCGPFVWPPADERVREALDAAWRDGDWGRYHGARCGQLCDALAAMYGVAHAHLCSSGTVAVELALRAVGVEPDDGVLLAGYDFPGNFRAIEAIGAVPVLVDIDPRSWSMDTPALEALAHEAEKLRVRAVVVSHLHGGLADMAALRELADRHGWKIVEDACQATGATLGGRAVGAWGDVGVLSFGGSKLLTAGRGGALLTDDAMIAQRLKTLNGRGNDAYPLSELQAAVLLPQVEDLPGRHAERLAAVGRLREQLRNHEHQLTPVKTVANASHAYYRFAWSLQSGKADSTQRVIAALAAEGAPAGDGFRGFATRSERRCRRLGNLREAIKRASDTITLHHPALTAGDMGIDQIAAAIIKVMHGLFGRA